MSDPSPPPGANVQRLAFVADRPRGDMVCELPAALGRWAVALPPGAPQAADLELLSLAADLEDGELAERLRAWASAPGTPAQTMAFQGARLFWGAQRAAVAAPAARLPALAGTLAEIAYFEAELIAVEAVLAAAWPDLEADGGPTFEFDERAARREGGMAARFRQLLGARVRLTRIVPLALAPHAYPPTLATQLHERLRERLRMRHRVEALQDQLEVFERVYDLCGQRANDFRAQRKSQLLEMVIIAFLAVQTLLALFDALKSSPAAPGANPVAPAAGS